jgi:hypothetical protein
MLVFVNDSKLNMLYKYIYQTDITILSSQRKYFIN